MNGLALRVQFLWLPRFFYNELNKIVGIYWLRSCVEVYSEDLGWVVYQKDNHKGVIQSLILDQGIELTYRGGVRFTLSGPPREVECSLRRLLSNRLVELEFGPEYSTLDDDILNEKYIYVKSNYLYHEGKRYNLF